MATILQTAFSKHFLEKIWYFEFIKNLPNFGSLGFNCQQVSIGSGNGLQPKKL